MLTVRAGQVHQFDLAGSWRAWLVIFLPEFVRGGTDRHQALLASSLDALPAHLPLDPDEKQAVEGVLGRLVDDARAATAAHEFAAMLRSQVESLIFRLAVTVGRRQGSPDDAAGHEARFRRFAAAVEKHFTTMREVADYAHLLRCSERTLSRTTQEVRGLSAKAFLDGRVILEAKRLLAHTDQTAAEIGAALGFDEPTNFGKFFRRNVGCSPGAFRARYR